MTSPSNNDDIIKALADFTERKGDVLETIQATKGPAYAAYLAAVAAVSNTYRSTNSMICSKFPKLLVEIIAEAQSTAVQDLIEPFFFLQFPDMKERHEACDEFVKNLTVLLEQRQAVENDISKVLKKYGEDDDNSDSDNEDSGD